MIINNAKNLDEIYVVCKKVKASFFFVGYSYAVTKSSVTQARQYATRPEAEEVAKKWTEQQKKKFKVEPLSKFMVNDFKIEFNRYRSVHDCITVTSKPVSVNYIKNFGKNFSIDLQNRKNDIVRDISTKISDLKREFENEERDIAEKIKQHENRKLALIKDSEAFELLKNEVDSLDFASLTEGLKTKTDTTINTLYGKKEVPKEATVETMILMPRKDDGVPF